MKIVGIEGFTVPSTLVKAKPKAHQDISWDFEDEWNASRAERRAQQASKQIERETARKQACVGKRSGLYLSLGS